MAMRIESVREKASGTLEVALSGGLLFSFDAKDAQLLGCSFDRGARTLVAAGADPVALVRDGFLDEESVSALGRLVALHRARMDALSIVSRAEQASKQLYEKLVKRGYEPEIARTCLQWLCDERYVDDRRYVTLLLRSHLVRRGQGPDRVKTLAWPRIGLFENPRIILSEAFAALEDDSMQEAIRRNSANILRRSKNFSRGGRGLGRGYPWRTLRPAQASDEPDAVPQGMSFAEKRSLLRAHLKNEGFPSKAIEEFLESWEDEADDKD
jgi:SOS response regulatory protein OraA/RecX